ncbi:hypothetical protein FACS1894176_09160 [Bacteroidia bacterium]|nr:hypothetical protein FACS1894176_09160 [Bacteroidia bacterium]
MSGWGIDLERYGNGSDMYVDYVRVFAEDVLNKTTFFYILFTRLNCLSLQSNITIYGSKNIQTAALRQ